MQFVVAIVHQILLLAIAAALRGTDVHAVNAHLERLPLGLDAVHTHLALSVITAVSPQGMAVAGIPGEWLHRTFPSAFLDPALVTPGVWISAVLARGSSLPGLFATRLAVEIILIVIGALIVRAGTTARGGWYLVRHPRLTLTVLAALGLYMQAQGIWGILRMVPSVSELEVMGLGYLTRNLLAEVADQYPWFAYYIIPQLVMVLLVIFALTLVPALEFMLRAVHRVWLSRFRGKSATGVPVADRSGPVRSRHVLVGFVCMFALAAILPRTLYARSSVRYTAPKAVSQSGERARGTSIPSPAALEIKALQAPTPTPTLRPTTIPTARVPATGPAPTAIPTATPTPPPVQVERSPLAHPIVQVLWSPARAHFVITDKNGELFKIRAVNYNTHYTKLPKDEQLRILRRDFQKMRAAGANVITGYGTFDETTLEVAKEFGISVIMPYVPDLNGDYTSAAYREQVKKDFAAFIKRFENYDSLLMWNFDDEPVHNMIERVGRPPEQAQALTDFLFELAEFAYRTDRYHRPSWIKEPRDWYLDIFAKSIERARARARNTAPADAPVDPSVYAILARSSYGAPLDIQTWLPILSNKVERELHMPFAVGEYGVVGVDPSERAYHLLQIWGETQQATAIGAGVYTYGPFQPNWNDLTDPAIAAQLQLVDENAVPLDDSWEKLAEAWRTQAAEESARRVRSSIALALPEFSATVDRYGGYPSSGPIEEGLGIKQFFVDGKRDGRTIAYSLTWNESRQRVEFSEVDRVVFNELGNFKLDGLWLKEYMQSGGYARFGAPTSDPQPMPGSSASAQFQLFAKGWRMVKR